ncbi:MAG: transposase [Bacteroidetes bacterium]|nr:transposase [Bacteroidota bacterium]
MLEAILYRLKTGCQWRQFPTKQFFSVRYRWQSIYHHFQKRCKDGSWEKDWEIVLKKKKTSNLLILTNIRGIPLACSEAISGNHHDAYALEKTVDNMLQSLRLPNIRTDCLFLNADSGFDTESFCLFYYVNFKQLL